MSAPEARVPGTRGNKGKSLPVVSGSRVPIRAPTSVHLYGIIPRYLRSYVLHRLPVYATSLAQLDVVGRK